MKNLLLCLLLSLVSAAINQAFAQQFNPAVYYAVGPASDTGDWIVGADFNNDGHLDLAMSEGYYFGTLQGVAILEGKADGTFERAGFVSVPDFAWTLAAADVNGDGIPDLLIIVPGAPGKLLVYLGNGNFTFTLHQSYSVPDGPIGLTVADFNEDGYPDIAIANSDQKETANGYASIWFGNGKGDFKASTIQLFAGSHPWAIAAGDLNGDGSPDLVVADDNSFGGTGNTLHVLINRGNGTFEYGESFQTGTESLGLAIADLNQDGIPDLVVASAFSDSGPGVYTLLGNGDGTFGTPAFYSSEGLGVGTAPQAVAVADFNLDGIPDIFVRDYTTDSGVMYGNGDGTFQAPVLVSVYGGSSLVVGDFNGDGAPDVATASFENFPPDPLKAGVLINTQSTEK
jgi:FG-GAP-like repeat/FG-GAP repeat